MDLKQALTVCLISLFSATLVVLIARTLDSQAASRLEPQLIRIGDELAALRAGGGVAAQPSPTPASATRDGVTVYYFHATTRCPTCRAIEASARQLVESRFAAQLQQGVMTWKSLNYERAPGAELAAKFDIQVPVVVVARIRNGEIEQWRRLDKVWPLAGDPEQFNQYVGEEIEKILGGESPTPATPEADDDQEESITAAPGNMLPLPSDQQDTPISLPDSLDGGGEGNEP